MNISFTLFQCELTLSLIEKVWPGRAVTVVTHYTSRLILTTYGLL